MSETDILVLEQLRKYFPVGGGFLGRYGASVKALEDIDLTVQTGESLGIVGESGCGKTTLARCILRLIEPSNGKILFEGRDIMSYGIHEMRRLRREMQMVFQDPYSSLDPRKRVSWTLTEPFFVHRMFNKPERRDKVAELMKTVGLHPEQAGRYPHEFSGGQRQRICIARALALQPKLIIADEPVSALDVSIQAQILNLMVDLQDAFHLTYILISHDLGVVRHLTDRVAIMYLGRIVELSSTDGLFRHQMHPYAFALISALPRTNPKKKVARVLLEGGVPSSINPPPGCPFHPRCPDRQKICTREVPSLREIENGHLVACHFPRT